MDDIILNKKESIERCIKQIRKYYVLPSNIPFKEDYFKQDAIAINLQRACQQCVDLANYIIRQKKLGLPKESRDSFKILAENKIILPSLADNLQKMVGFRNVLVHEYQLLDIELMKRVIENHLDELIDYTNQIASNAN